ncbi:MAG: chloride channel protein [Acetobacteraceae bacterium]
MNDASPSDLHQPVPMQDANPRGMPLPLFCILALVVGVVTGLGAVLFRALIGLVHNVLFLGEFSFVYDSSVFTPESPWGIAVILVPVIGAIGVTFIVSTFAPEAKGHGVPEVMDAIYYKKGVIRPIVAVAKSLASALAIGSGAAVGREGPIIQIGSALGSTFGQVIRMSMGQRVTLVAAGAGAGIAATFNTPIGGVIFATELMMPEVSVNTFLPVAIATATATFIGRIFFGTQPAFSVPSNLGILPQDESGLILLALYVVLGGIVGIAAAIFIRGLHWAEDAFDRIPGRYVRHAFGMALVGLLIWSLMRWRGHYFVDGVGYDTITATLNGSLTGPGFLLLLFVGKLFATSVSLGSGSSGGIFSPSLFMGATLGAAFGTLVAQMAPGLPVSVPAFAMVGMGAMVGGGTGAAMTAVTMIFEMTLDYQVVLPMILAVASALGMRRLLSRESIYSIKLARRGHPIPTGLHANLFMVRGARDVMQSDISIADEARPVSAVLADLPPGDGTRHVVVTRNERIVGALTLTPEMRRAIAGDTPLRDLGSHAFTLVREDAVAFDVINRLWRRRAALAIVIARGRSARAGAVRGVITKEHIADTVAGSVQIFPS